LCNVVNSLKASLLAFPYYMITMFFNRRNPLYMKKLCVNVPWRSFVY